MPEPAKAPICVEKERLSKRVLQAISQLTALKSKQSASRVSGVAGLPEIEEAIEAARKRWDKARESYAQHLRDHGC